MDSNSSTLNQRKNSNGHLASQQQPSAAIHKDQKTTSSKTNILATSDHHYSNQNDTSNYTDAQASLTAGENVNVKKQNSQLSSVVNSGSSTQHGHQDGAQNTQSQASVVNKKGSALSLHQQNVNASRDASHFSNVHSNMSNIAGSQQNHQQLQQNTTNTNVSGQEVVQKVVKQKSKTQSESREKLNSKKDGSKHREKKQKVNTQEDDVVMGEDRLDNIYTNHNNAILAGSKPVNSTSNINSSSSHPNSKSTSQNTKQGTNNHNVKSTSNVDGNAKTMTSGQGQALHKHSSQGATSAIHTTSQGNVEHNQKGNHVGNNRSHSRGNSQPSKGSAHDQQNSGANQQNVQYMANRQNGITSQAQYNFSDFHSQNSQSNSQGQTNQQTANSQLNQIYNNIQGPGNMNYNQTANSSNANGQGFDQQNFTMFSSSGNSNNGQGFQFNGFGQQVNAAQVNAIMNSMHPPPQVHFIANKQKFYQQVSPDKAPMIFNSNTTQSAVSNNAQSTLQSNDKRPYTANNIQNLSASANSTKRAASVYNNNNKVYHPTQPGNTQIGTANATSATSGTGPSYTGGIGSKTHTQGFGAGSGSYSQNYQKILLSGSGIMTNPNILEQNQLHMQSVFSAQLPSSIHHNNNGISQTTKKLSKIKPDKMTVKEKEQLYEEAIKLKIVANNHKEENIKLKTKIKILENEMIRKEKAMEDFFQQNQFIQNAQKNSGQNGGNLAPIAQTAQKYQQETFLVMSLKKQVKELKLDHMRKEEELLVAKKNMKNTKVQEQDHEIKMYKEECIRMRKLCEEMITQGPNHHLHKQNQEEKFHQYQIKIKAQEKQLQQLQEYNHELQIKLRHKDDDVSSKQLTSSANNNINDETQASRETKSKKSSSDPASSASKDLLKAKKQIREKDKEISKLQKELMELKKHEGILTSSKAMSQEHSAHTTNEPKKDHSTPNQEKLKQLQAQLANQQIKNKDLKKEIKSKGDQLEDLHSKLSKNEKRHAQQLKDLQERDKQVKKLQEENEELVKQVEKEREREKQIKHLSEQCGRELKNISLVGQREKISRDDLAQRLKDDQKLNGLLRNQSEDFVELVTLCNYDELMMCIPRYSFNFDYDEKMNAMGEKVLKLIEKAKFEKEESMLFGKFSSSAVEHDIDLTGEQLDFIKYAYLDHIDRDEVLIDVKKLIEDIQNKEVSKPKNSPKQSTAKKDPSTVKKRGPRSLKDQESDDEDDKTSKRSEKSRMLSPKDMEKKYQEEEQMLDIAEHCFIKIAEYLIYKGKTVKSIFLKYCIPEQFPDGTVLELMSPRAFIEGIKDIGMIDFSEIEAAALMKVLAKPELENAIILNELIQIMENFGVSDHYMEEDDEDDYIGTDDEVDEINGKPVKREEKKKAEAGTETDNKEDKKESEEADSTNKIIDTETDTKKETTTQGDEEGDNKAVKKTEESKEEKKEAKEEEEQEESKKRPPILRKRLRLSFDKLEEKGLKILKKLARFLLERYMHPREFFGPSIFKEQIKSSKRNNTVEVIQIKDFYLRMKLASIRKKIKECENLNEFLAIDLKKYPKYLQVKKVVRALEEVAEGEQQKLMEEMALKEKEEAKKVEEEAENAIKQEELKEKIKKNRKEDNDDLKTGDKIYSDDEIELQKLIKQQKEKAAEKSDYLSGYDEYFKSESFGIGKGSNKYSQSKAMMHHNHLNTIEEEKFETQTSNYNGDGQSDASRMLNSQQLKGSKVLGEINDNLDDSTKRSGGLDKKEQFFNKSIQRSDKQQDNYSSEEEGDGENKQEIEFNDNIEDNVSDKTDKIPQKDSQISSATNRQQESGSVQLISGVVVNTSKKDIDDSEIEVDIQNKSSTSHNKAQDQQQSKTNTTKQQNVIEEDYIEDEYEQDEDQETKKKPEQVDEDEIPHVSDEDVEGSDDYEF